MPTDNPVSPRTDAIRNAPDHPGSRRITLAPQLPNQGLKGSPWSQQAIKSIPQFLILIAGQEDVFRQDWEVEFWQVGVLPVASVLVNVVPGDSASGPGWRFTGGGKATIPGNGNALAVRNIGATTLTIVAIATVGYPLIPEYTPGGLA